MRSRNHTALPVASSCTPQALESWSTSRMPCPPGTVTWAFWRMACTVTHPWRGPCRTALLTSSLVSNAVLHGPRQGWVTVQAIRQNAQFTAAVTDQSPDPPVCLLYTSDAADE